MPTVLVHDANDDSVTALLSALGQHGIEAVAYPVSADTSRVLDDALLDSADRLIVVWSKGLRKHRGVVVAGVEQLERSRFVQVRPAGTQVPLPFADVPSLVLSDAHDALACAKAIAAGPLVAGSPPDALIHLAEIARTAYVGSLAETFVEVQDFTLRSESSGWSIAPEWAAAAARVLRNNRAFEALSVFVDHWLWTHRNAPEPYRVRLRIALAQANIELGRFGVALDVLDRTLWMRSPGFEEFRDLQGLRGRVFKQIWVRSQQSGSIEPLREALKAYTAGLQRVPVPRDDYVGINAIAVQAALTRHGDTEPMFDVQEMATRLIAELPGKKDTPWWHAVLGEAHVALGQWEKAVRHYGAFVVAPSIQPFHVESATRQLREIWELDPSVGGQGQLLQLMLGASIARESSVTRLTADLTALDQESEGVTWTDDALSPEKFPEGNPGFTDGGNWQATIGAHRARPIRWLSQAIARAHSVAKIMTSRRTLGTGFVIRASDIWQDARPNDRLLLTNAHVVSAGGASAHIELLGLQASSIQPTTPQRAQLAFEFGWPGTPDGRLEGCRLVWEHPAALLDAALLSVPGLSGPDRPFLPLSTKMPDLYVPGAHGRKRRSRVYVIGHPAGQELHVNVEDGKLFDITSKRELGAPFQHIQFLHYESPTLKGNSGSPVFDEEGWEVIGLHHMGGVKRRPASGTPTTRRRMANEGISIFSIVDAIRSEHPTPPVCG